MGRTKVRFSSTPLPRRCRTTLRMSTKITCRQLEWVTPRNHCVFLACPQNKHLTFIYRFFFNLRQVSLSIPGSPIAGLTLAAILLPLSFELLRRLPPCPTVAIRSFYPIGSSIVHLFQQTFVQRPWRHSHVQISEKESWISTLSTMLKSSLTPFQRLKNTLPCAANAIFRNTQHFHTFFSLLTPTFWVCVSMCVHTH